MIHTVVCTDLNDYVNWQVELLEYSWSRVNQPGKLVRLVACDNDVAMPQHRHAEVYRTRPVDVHPQSGDVYVCYNRLFSLQQWLVEENISGTILVVDCDVVFTAAIKTQVSKGNPIGQHWLDFGIHSNARAAIQETSDVDPDGLQPITWPMLIDADDLRTLIPRWIEATVYIRQKTKGQESDMYAFLVAANELNLNFQLGKITAFMPWPDEQVVGASLIHYCQPVRDEDGERLWGKWRYKPWTRVKNADQAKLMYCRDLLKLVDEYARLKHFEASQKNKTIFIAMASYCEPELIDTIESCLKKARYPENLRFGICHQFDNADKLTSDTCLDQYSQDTRFRYVMYDYSDSKGGCWARNIAQQLYNDETYTLQIDSHTQMIESWDTLLIEMLELMPSDKPLITTFPPLYSIEPDGNKIYREIEDLSQVNTAVVAGWSTGGWLNYVHDLPKNSVSVRGARVLSGAFVFTTGEWNHLVRQDPKFLYVGEEFALTLRSFTHGYDLFDPTQTVCWHRLHLQPNRKFKSDNSEVKCRAKHQLAISRLRLLIEGDSENKLGEFGLGALRSLQDYAQITGIDCIRKTVTEAAQQGLPIVSGISDAIDTSFEQYVALAETGCNAMLDVTIHLAHKEPLKVACTEDTPVLLSLFQGLRDKSLKPDDVIYLNVGEAGVQGSVLFKQSQLVAIETSPALGDGFFSQLTPLSDTAAGNQAVDLEPMIESSQAIRIAPKHSPILGGEISDDWKVWIWHNLGRGCSKDVIFKQLIEHGFAWHVVKVELNYEPSVPLNEINMSEAIDQSKFDYQPNSIARRIESDELEIYSIDSFLNLQECQELSEVILANLEASTTVSNAAGVSNSGRTSSTCFFNVSDPQHALAFSVSERISRLIGINHGYAETVQGQAYNPGEEYKAHNDWFEPGTPELESQAGVAVGGQRTWSVVIYLNEVELGGETVFERAGVTVHPKPGNVVFWNNLAGDGSTNQNALHQACPVKKGQKVVLTLWYRSFGEGSMYTREPYEFVPSFTQSGIQLTTMPEALFQALSSFYQKSSLGDSRDEHIEGDFLLSDAGTIPSSLIALPKLLRQAVIDALLPICEEWSQQELNFSALYGVRIYHRGASLRMHTDSEHSHIISVILNLGQEVDRQWPLIIEDHMFRRHAVYLKPGEMILYEGSRLCHGRPEAFQGESYANLFVHFCPKNNDTQDPVKAIKGTAL
ncbi:MAG: prolyl 4-hydroxylase [Arenicella sp.]|jgi:prolyl 4-hydroxylase